MWHKGAVVARIETINEDPILIEELASKDRDGYIEFHLS